LTALDVCSPKSSGYKGVKFGMNTDIRADVMMLFQDNLSPPKKVLTALDTCSPKSSGYKGVKFGMTTDFHWDWSLTKNY
jgi:hypothetical protein